MSLEDELGQWDRKSKDFIACLFDRAWAYSGFCELARRFPQFQAEATHVLNEALSSETAGSVLSRVRRELQREF